MIIGFAGRKESGKSAISEVCQEFGYKRLSFAYPLKHLIANMIGVHVDKINELKNVDTVYTFNDTVLKFFSDETGVPLSVANEKLKNKEFHTVRELLQYIGTDVIRAYNENWHCNKIKEILQSDLSINYVIDDVRFENEKNAILECGGEVWFIIRPIINNISNHISETSLDWRDFDNVIVNNHSLRRLKKHWRKFFKDYRNNMEKRYNLSSRYRTGSMSFIEFAYSFCTNRFEKYYLYAGQLKPYDLYPNYLYAGLLDAKQEKNGTVVAKYLLKNDGSYTIRNIVDPFYIENLKRYVTKEENNPQGGHAESD